MRTLLRRFSYLLRRDRYERELDAELQFHVEMKQQELEARGADRHDAGLAARRAVGNLPLANNRVRDVWIWPWLQDAMLDLRVTVRSFRRSPGFTAAVIVTLALGLGVNLLAFAASYGLLVRPLPYEDASRIVTLRVERTDGFSMAFRAREIDRWLTERRTPAAIAAYHATEATVRGVGDPMVLPVAFVTASFFDVTLAMRSIASSMVWGPTLQFTPTTSAPHSSSRCAKTSGGVPSRLLPSSSMVIWATMGLLETWRTPWTAASTSLRSEKVSRM